MPWAMLLTPLFLSTLPARGATARAGSDRKEETISIHAPREGSDPPRCPRSGRGPSYFYPRSPRGERPRLSTPAPAARYYFYPRSPRGERRANGAENKE